MKPALKAYLLLIAQLVAGIAVLLMSQSLHTSSETKTGVIFFALLALNLLYVRIFRLKDELFAYWSIRKLPQFFAGASGGLLLAVIPLSVAIIAGKTGLRIVHFDKISVTSILLTAVITGWEELWFRGLLLNYCSSFLSKINISIAIGVLFVVIHLLNPAINLRKEWLELLLAGTLLTTLYFYYRSIWICAGLHFGNNFFGSVIHSNIENHVWLGREGYIYCAILLLATVYFLFRLSGQAYSTTLS